MHIREFTEFGEVAGKGGVTVAFEVNGNTLVLAFAECSRKDNFCKRIGRDVASGRLRAGKGTTYEILSDNPKAVIADLILPNM